MNRITSDNIPDNILAAMPAKAKAQYGSPLPFDLPTKPCKLEKELQHLCELELSRRGIEHLHLSPRAREKAGWPDLTFVLDGVPYAVELKTAAGRLSEAQERVLGRMACNGWRCVVVRSIGAFVELMTVPALERCDCWVEWPSSGEHTRAE